jgi:hypothetical protein
MGAKIFESVKEGTCPCECVILFRADAFDRSPGKLEKTKREPQYGKVNEDITKL